MSSAERFKFEFLATLVHEGTLQPLTFWLADAPVWAEDFVAQLLRDDVLYLFRSGSDDDVVARLRDRQAPLSEPEARALLASAAAREAWDVVLAPTASGAERFSEQNASEMSQYVSDRGADARPC